MIAGQRLIAGGDDSDENYECRLDHHAIVCASGIKNNIPAPSYMISIICDRPMRSYLGRRCYTPGDDEDY